MRLAILFNSGSRDVDGVADHARMLSRALVEAGDIVTLIDYRDGHWCVAEESGSRDASAANVAASLRACDWVILEYSPFGMARWGFAPWTLLWACAASRLSRLALFVHEPYVREGRGRRRLISVWQRLQLRLLLRWTAAALVPIEQSCDLITGLRPGLVVGHIPVGSNLPDRRTKRAARRSQLGVEDHVVVAVFSTGHESRLDEHLGHALRALSATGRPVLALNLGAGASPLPPIDGIPVISPGWLEADVLAEYLSAADLFLSPLADGASMRRTTIAAALQHGLPVISTDGYLTDRQLRARDSGIEMIDVDDPARFGAAAAALAGAPVECARRGEQARLAYTRTWSWPSIVESLVAVLDKASGASGSGEPGR